VIRVTEEIRNEHMSGSKEGDSSLEHKKQLIPQLARKVVDLGSGEVVARLFAVATIILLGHRYGVIALGAYALAQTLSQYLQPVIDFGLRHIGARLVALYPTATANIIRKVEWRRLHMALAALPLLFMYCFASSMPQEASRFVFVFAAMSATYALSLEWAAWGKDQLRFVGFLRTIVPGAIFAVLVLKRPPLEQLYLCILAANALGCTVQVGVSFLWWRTHRRIETNDEIIIGKINEALSWQRSSLMGLAWLCNVAFNSIDLLMLGLLAPAFQVGLYSAGYRVINQVLATYYLATQALFPRFARYRDRERIQATQFHVLFKLFFVGALLCFVIAAGRRFIVALFFGSAFAHASALLLVLSLAIPMDFITSYLSNAYIAWGLERTVLFCTSSAAVTNVLLNWVFIPRFGAIAAAINTLLSYGVFLALLASVRRRATVSHLQAACSPIS